MSLPPAPPTGKPGAGVAATILVLAILAVSIWATSGGLRIIPRDSPTYLASAESLASGDGYQVPFADRGKPVEYESTSSPVIDFPPGYPFAISLGLRSGLSSLDSARVLAVLVVVASGALTFALAWVRSRSRTVALIAGSLVAALTLRASLGVLSDALFGLMVLVAVAAAGQFLRSGRTSWFITASGAAVLSAGVRTIGLSVALVMAAVAIVGFERGIKRVAWPSVPIAGGLLAFLGLVGEGNRTMAWHPPELDSVKIAVDAVSTTIVPPVGSPTLRLVGFAVLVAALSIQLLGKPLRRPTLRLDGSPAWVGLAAAAGQVAVLLATWLLFDAQTTPNARLLYPVVLALVVSALEWLPDRATVPYWDRARRLTVGLLAMALVSVSWSVAVEGTSVRNGSALELGGTRFLENPVVSHVATNVPGETVFSNLPDGLWMAGVSGVRSIPTVFDPLSRRPNPNREEEMAQLGRALADVQGYVFFYRPTEFDYLVSEQMLRRLAPCVILEHPDAVLLVAATHPDCLS